MYAVIDQNRALTAQLDALRPQLRPQLRPELRPQLRPQLRPGAARPESQAERLESPPGHTGRETAARQT